MVVSVIAYRDLGSAWNGDDVLALSQEPRESDLARRRVVFFADLLQAVGQLEDVREVLFRVTRYLSAEVTLLEIIRACL